MALAFPWNKPQVERGWKCENRLQVSHPWCFNALLPNFLHPALNPETALRQPLPTSEFMGGELHNANVWHQKIK